MAEMLSEELLTEFRAAFRLFDGHGCIIAEKLAEVMDTFNHGREEIEETADGEDPDRTTMELTDFFSLIDVKMKDYDDETELREAFKVFDRDQNGYISPEELKHVMVSLGEKLTDDEVDQMIREADYDGDGQVNYEEFNRMMKLM